MSDTSRRPRESSCPHAISNNVTAVREIFWEHFRDCTGICKTYCRYKGVNLFRFLQPPYRSCSNVQYWTFHRPKEMRDHTNLCSLITMEDRMNLGIILGDRLNLFIILDHPVIIKFDQLCCTLFNFAPLKAKRRLIWKIYSWFSCFPP
jgi:hypothetical protein